MTAADLLDDHRVFDRVLAQLRSDVHGRRLRSARERFDWLDRAIRAHLDLEERELLPRFDALEHPVPNGAPDVFRRDHQLILDRLDQAREGWEDPEIRADALARLDGVLEHHDLREARYFKPRLDLELDPSVMERILEGWERAVEPVVDPDEAVAQAPIPGLLGALSVGDLRGARAELDGLGSLDGKAARLARRVRGRLDAGDLVGAYDAARLLDAVLGVIA